ncbi:MAG: TolC family protein [Marinifilaceae bacterium]
MELNPLSIKVKKRIFVVYSPLLFLSIFFNVLDSKAQSLTLNSAIVYARQHSSQAKMARFSFMNQYWNFRSYKAERLPSLVLSGDIGNYDRSLVEVRDYETGNISYVENNSLSNNLRLSVNQNIALTGGQFSLNSYASRLDQYRYDETTYNTNPFTLNYTQPLKAYNSLKWRKRTEPLRYENSKKKYLETLEQISLTTTSYFFYVLSAQAEYKKSMENLRDRTQLYETAQKRFELGTTTRSEILQLKLSVLNAELSVNTTKQSLEMQLFNFCSYIGLKDRSSVELLVPQNVPDIALNYEQVLDNAYRNSTHSATQQLKLLESKRALAQAKSTRGLQADFRLNLGFSQNANEFKAAYQNLKDREVVGLTLRMPLYDWGLGKGKVKMAEADLDITQTEIELAEVEFRQNIWNKVVQFNNQFKQCEISGLAQEIAAERYDITCKRFQNGTITVTELNTAQQESDNARSQYINALRTYWTAYYELQKLSLYDYVHKKDLSVDFDNLIK